ncbi:MAG: fasciclin domain-containing protein [Myxococcota bacterium]
MSRFLSLALAGLIVPVSTAFAAPEDMAEKADEMAEKAEGEMAEGEMAEGEMAEGEEAAEEMVEEVKTNTIVDVAAGNDSFSTLVKAVQAAGLVDVLSGEGPFTVFAPTNEAFAEVDDLDAILADKEKLAGILKYHVISGKVMSKDVASGKVATVQGDDVKIKVKGNGSVKVGKANVTATDVAADNGVIHVIDRVIMP